MDQDQKHSSLRSLLSGAASPRAAALLCEPARDGGLPADLFLADVLDSNCRSEPARDGDLTADLFLADVLDSNCRSEPARDGDLTADLFLADVLDSNCGSEPARDGGPLVNKLLSSSRDPAVGAAEGCDLLILLLLFCGGWLASDGDLTADLFLADVLDSNCGSEPARESGLSDTSNVECAEALTVGLAPRRSAA
ncbi:hypothetical protein LIS66_04620 [Pseudomonas sp. HN2]|uniref:hypothetical protein n=1 Tax=Pseudomonas sp. HN2 TaxID=2884805 RepID=UPI001D140F83|nr:hypothetical protein [Pseudomonas sp. HN2]UEB96861.1 hypothetical protein LIS66_04620 [Pseudomonas sp. HN2]